MVPKSDFWGSGPWTNMAAEHIPHLHNATRGKNEGFGSGRSLIENNRQNVTASSNKRFTDVTIHIHTRRVSVFGGRR